MIFLGKDPEEFSLTSLINGARIAAEWEVCFLESLKK
jgi:hypothetical protein